MANVMILKDETIEHDASGITKAFDVSALKVLFLTLVISEVTGTNPTLDLWLEHSADGVNWRNLYDDFKQGAFPRLTATGTRTMQITKFTKFLRASWFMGGSSASFTFDLAAKTQA